MHHDIWLGSGLRCRQGTYHLGITGFCYLGRHEFAREQGQLSVDLNGGIISRCSWDKKLDLF
jgi:hypothetical protein